MLGRLVAHPPGNRSASAGGRLLRYKAAVLPKASSAAPGGGLRGQHTAETYFVGTVPDTFGVPSKASKAKICPPAGPAPSEP